MRERLRVGLRRAFVDTSACYALGDPRDANHQQARSLANTMADEHWRLLSTNFIVAETHALTLNRLGRATAARVLEEMERGITVLRASAADERRAREILRRYSDKDFSLTDAISFAVMERLALTYAFTFDRHFAQYGFTILTPDHLEKADPAP